MVHVREPKHHGGHEDVGAIAQAGAREQWACARAEDPLLREGAHEEIAHEMQGVGRSMRVGEQLEPRGRVRVALEPRHYQWPEEEHHGDAEWQRGTEHEGGGRRRPQAEPVWNSRPRRARRAPARKGEREHGDKRRERGGNPNSHEALPDHPRVVAIRRAAALPAVISAHV